MINTTKIKTKSSTPSQPITKTASKTKKSIPSLQKNPLTTKTSTNTTSTNTTFTNKKNPLTTKPATNTVNDKKNADELQKAKYGFSLFNFHERNIGGIYPVMLNLNKVLSVLKSQNIKLTPKNSYKLIGEYINQYDKQLEGTDAEKVASNKELIQLNNNYETLLELIRLFAPNGSIGTISPRGIINTINSIALYYEETNKREILLHLAYFAEVVYEHMSTLIDNSVMERNDFFESETGLDYPALKDCSEFYYTDIYMMNSKERLEYLKLLNSYYLEEILEIEKEQIANTQAASRNEKILQAETELERKSKMTTSNTATNTTKSQTKKSISKKQS